MLYQHHVYIIDDLDLGFLPSTTRREGTTHLVSSTTPPSLGRQRAVLHSILSQMHPISVNIFYLVRSSLGAVQ